MIERKSCPSPSNMQIQRPPWEILSTMTAAEKFTSADVACACDRCLVAQKLTKQQSRKKEMWKVTQQPMWRWRLGGIASRWPCKGIVVPLRVRSCSE